MNTIDKETIEFTVDVLQSFFPDEPCNYNDMDEYTDCDWCNKNCDSHIIKDCWIHALENGWYKNKEA